MDSHPEFTTGEIMDVNGRQQLSNDFPRQSVILRDEHESNNYTGKSSTPQSTMDNVQSSRALSSMPSPSDSAVERMAKMGSKRFVTKMAAGGTLCTVVALLLLAISFSEWGETESIIQTSRRHRVGQRHLEQDNDNGSSNADAVDNGTDYSTYRCDEIFTHGLSPTDQCQYAKSCDEGEGTLLTFPFCRNLLSPLQWVIVISPVILLGLTLLFRLLGSTAEDYFSPSLEMFSFKLGLPPRFAGVSLLALGNGAADVSATMNAVRNDPENGYKMSLGALTGAAMFITTVVAGSVILANGGLTCRGALVRDVLALGIAVVVVVVNLETGSVGPGVSTVLTFSYIVLNFGAYHLFLLVSRLSIGRRNNSSFLYMLSSS